jgi:hypothetical protein
MSVEGAFKFHWGLRVGAVSTQRVLIRRYANEVGETMDGTPAAWKDIARFDSYNDAESVLRILVASEDQ